MATTPQTVSAAPDAPQDLQALAKRTSGCTSRGMSAYAPTRRPDHRPRRGVPRLGRDGQPLLDGLSRAVLRQRRPRARRDRRGEADQAEELGFFTNWSLRAPAAIELAAVSPPRARRPQQGVLHVGG